MKLQLHYYLLCVSQLLPYKGREKQNILKFIAVSIWSYVKENSIHSFRQVKEHFGSPEQVAAQYWPDGNPSKKKFLACKPIARILVFTCFWMAVLFGVFVLSIFLLQQFAPTVPVYEAAEIAQNMQCV